MAHERKLKDFVREAELIFEPIIPLEPPKVQRRFQEVLTRAHEATTKALRIPILRAIFDDAFQIRSAQLENYQLEIEAQIQRVQKHLQPKKDTPITRAQLHHASSQISGRDIPHPLIAAGQQLLNELHSEMEQLRGKKESFANNKLIRDQQALADQEAYSRMNELLKLCDGLAGRSFDLATAYVRTFPSRAPDAAASYAKKNASSTEELTGFTNFIVNEVLPLLEKSDDPRLRRRLRTYFGRFLEGARIGLEEELSYDDLSPEGKRRWEIWVAYQLQLKWAAMGLNVKPEKPSLI